MRRVSVVHGLPQLLIGREVRVEIIADDERNTFFGLRHGRQQRQQNVDGHLLEFRGLAVDAAVIEHDAVIEDFVFIAPHATIAGGARVGKLSLVGIGAAVLPMVIVGSETIVGAGAVVARDLPDGVVASGVPARVHRSVHEEISARSR